jgi:8-oxo-dGTP pyrophosphatase MutT (NUDIX family)
MLASSPLITQYLMQQPIFRAENLLCFHINGLALGLVEPHTAMALQQFDPRFVLQAQNLTLTIAHTARQALMDAAALHLRDLGLVKVWRDERYAVHPLTEQGQLDTQTMLFTLERGAFRRFGFCSQAVHINGISDGKIWLGRRASTKGIDPDRLDNLAAGGIPHGESVFDCLVRELAEEAGIASVLASTAVYRGQMRTRRNEEDGTHDEFIYCYDLALPSDITPHNIDGEVAGFSLHTPAEVITLLPEMTWDAGLVTAQLLQRLGSDL